MKTRRRFLQAAAAGAALPLLGEAPVEAGETILGPDLALAAIVRQRFKHLNAAQLKSVQAGLQRGLAIGEFLKRVPLDPLDEPATIFVADLPES